MLRNVLSPETAQGSALMELTFWGRNRKQTIVTKDVILHKVITKALWGTVTFEQIAEGNKNTHHVVT